MRNFLRAALILGTLSIPAVVLADTAKEAPAKTDEKPAADKTAPKTEKTTAKKTTAKKTTAKRTAKKS